jgi:hypothetical protein
LHVIDPRLFRGRLRELVETLWPDCTWPTCTKPATAGEIDHIHDHAAGGPTVAENGHPPCKQHHRRKTFEGWTTTRDPATGAIVWMSPYGHHYTVQPEPLTDADLMTPYDLRPEPSRQQPVVEAAATAGAPPPF